MFKMTIPLPLPSLQLVPLSHLVVDLHLPLSPSRGSAPPSSRGATTSALPACMHHQHQHAYTTTSKGEQQQTVKSSSLRVCYEHASQSVDSWIHTSALTHACVYLDPNIVH